MTNKFFIRLSHSKSGCVSECLYCSGIGGSTDFFVVFHCQKYNSDEVFDYLFPVLVLLVVRFLDIFLHCRHDLNVKFHKS